MEAILRKEIITNKELCRIIGVGIFVILTSLGAFVRIPLPFTPVPLTLQTFFVLLSGALLGARMGALAQASYVFLGLSGLPIFTAIGSGLGYLWGPTTGYLFGFVLASFFLGKTLEYSRNNIWRIFLLFCLADLMLLACGAIWLKIILGINIKTALFIGILPFIPGDLLKIAIGCGVYKGLKGRAKEIL